MLTKQKISRIAADAALNIENIIFPLFFLYFAVLNLILASSGFPAALKIFAKMKDQNFTVPDVRFISAVLTELLLFFCDILVAWSLIIRRNLYKKAEWALEILLPIIGTCFFLLYNLFPRLPQTWNVILMPKGLLMACSVFGTLVAAAGLIISIVATYHLRYSYGVLIQVRNVITTGLYRYVRHPIYFGYILFAFGLVILNPTLGYIVFSIVFVYVTTLRAVIEERKLALFCEEYRSYIESTPFIFPFKFNR